jgi:hypothetical protein
VETVHQLMSMYKSNPLDWRKYAKFDRYRWQTQDVYRYISALVPVFIF